MNIRTSNFITAEKFIKETIERNGFSAVIGEKGTGKSHTMRQVIGAYEQKGGYSVITITPMDEKVKNITQIMSAMIEDISGESPRRDVESRRRQLRRILGDSHSKIILSIDESQDLHKSTLRGLKKIHELGFGTKDKLFSILLFGQESLKDRISDDELKPRIRRHHMKGLTDKEKMEFIDESLFNDKSLSVFLKRTRKTPLSVITAHDELLAIRDDLGRKKIDEQIVNDYFFSDTREMLLSLNESYKKISDGLFESTGERVSPSAICQYVKGTYAGKNERLDGLLSAYATEKQSAVI
jgi:type II secretory pathway predicted ATPase ExeA